MPETVEQLKKQNRVLQADLKNVRSELADVTTDLVKGVVDPPVLVQHLKAALLAMRKSGGLPRVVHAEPVPIEPSPPSTAAADLLALQVEHEKIVNLRDTLIAQKTALKTEVTEAHKTSEAFQETIKELEELRDRRVQASEMQNSALRAARARVAELRLELENPDKMSVLRRAALRLRSALRGGLPEEEGTNHVTQAQNAVLVALGPDEKPSTDSPESRERRSLKSIGESMVSVDPLRAEDVLAKNKGKYTLRGPHDA